MFVSYQCPCSAQAGYIGTDRNLLMGSNALLLWQTMQTAMDLHMHFHTDMIKHDTAFVEPVSSTGERLKVGDIQIPRELSTKRNRAGMHHQCPNNWPCWHVHTSVGPRPDTYTLAFSKAESPDSTYMRSYTRALFEFEDVAVLPHFVEPVVNTVGNKLITCW